MEQTTIRSLLDFQYVSNPRFSPDGKTAAFVVQHPLEEENKYKGDLYLLDVESKSVKQLTTHGDAYGYVWTSKGTLLFSSMRAEADRKKAEEEPLSVFYEINPRGGEAQRAFEVPVKGASLILMNDETYVVSGVKENQEKGKDDAWEVLEESPFWFNGRGFTAGKRGCLGIYDRAHKEYKEITQPWFDASVCDVQEGKILYRGALWEGGMKYTYGGLYLYDMAADTHECLIAPESRSFGQAWFWQNGQILLATTDQSRYGRMEYNQFYLLDPVAKELSLLADYEYSIGYGTVGSDAKMGGGQGSLVREDGLYFLSNIEEHTFLKHLALDGTITDVYNKCKAQLLCPKERFVNYVKEIYAPFSDEEIAAKMVEILKSDNVNA
ncbi:MAG: PD40 domain-containing protein, partial [Firmicutes bacterium]|nr:PD40 domain-containing protein [Bacillota bacterium]